MFLMMRLVQTVPLSLLVFAAFPDRDLRQGRRRSCLISVSYMILSSVAMALLSPVSSENGQRNIIARDLCLVVFLSIFFVWWMHSVRVPAIRKGLVFGLLLHYWMILQTLGDVFAALILRDSYAAEVSAEAGSLTYNLCVLAATALTWPLLYAFLRNSLRNHLLMLDSREAKRGGAYLFIIFLLFSVATYNPHFDLLPDTPLFVISMVITDMIAYFIFFQEVGTVRKQAETARELAIWQTQYQQLSQRMEESRRLRHDLRHHLNTLGALNAQGKQEEITDYLKQYGAVYDQLEEQRFSGDPVVDSVLEYYLTQAGEEGIPVQCRVSLEGGGSGVDATDMTVLLGNCLENALEALRPLPAQARLLSVEIAPRGVMLLVRIVNTCGNLEDGRDFAGWEAFPSCKGKGRKGVGLRSVAAIAEKYGGSAQFQRKNGEFTARISLCMCWQNDIG